MGRRGVMAEHHMRCRFWPHCAIHTGEQRLMASVSWKERQEITTAYCLGEAPGEIARKHSLSVAQVWRIQRQVKKRESRVH